MPQNDYSCNLIDFSAISQYKIFMVSNNDTNWTVAALYRFVALEDLPAIQTRIRQRCDALDICGTLLIAPEGMNGTIAGQGDAIPQIIELLNDIAGIEQGELKYSSAAERPFRRIKVRLKQEIITMKAPEANPTEQVGTYVKPADWNTLINDPEVTLIDTRNDYETAVGIFDGAIDPNIKTFTEFKNYVAENMDATKQKKVAMFCTGGQDLEESPYQLCYGCRWPLTEADIQNSAYEKGVSCPHCIDTLTEEKAHAFRMRHEQMKKAGEEIPGDCC